VSPAEAPIQHRVAGNGIELSILELGPADAPCVVMLHGLRDTAWSLLPVAGHLAEHPAHPFRVLICELRGHGASNHSAAYSMSDFLLDLHAVINTLAPQGCALFGHSLGGHIVTKYAALFHELVTALVIVEGLGPPRRPHEGDDVAELQAYRNMLLTRAIARDGPGKPIADIDEVVNRLCRNNPRLDASAAVEFAAHLVNESMDGLLWAFDPRANSVFLGTSTTDNMRFWRQVRAPACIVSGTLSHEYWGREMGDETFTGRFAEGEMEQRINLFPNAQHHWFEHSGHMVHYDEPDRLARLTRKFLEENHV